MWHITLPFPILQHGPRALAVRNEEIFACFKHHHQLKVYTYNKDEPVLKEEICLKEKGKDIIINNPRGMAVDDEYIYITDSYSHKLYKFTRKGKLIKSVGGCGKRIGELHGPKDITIVGSYIFVCDLFNQRVQCFNKELDATYAMYNLKESHIFPIHITSVSTHLYIAGTNRIYVCSLTGPLRKPKVGVVYSVTQYKPEGQPEKEFERIGGIAVKKYKPDEVLLLVTETFQNSVLVLSLNTQQAERDNTPLLIGIHYGIDNEKEPSVEQQTHESNEEFIFVHKDQQLSSENKNEDEGGEIKFKKPHPIVIYNKNFVTSTDSKKEKIVSICLP